jgi:hypothetical protein
MRRESQMREQEERDRDLRERDAHFRESLMRGNIGPYGRPEQRQPPTGPSGHMDWTSGVNRPPQRDGWQHCLDGSAPLGRVAFASNDNAYEAFNLLCKMT